MPHKHQAGYNKIVHIQENADLKNYSTMRLGGTARYAAEAGTDQEIQALVKWAKDRNLPFMAVGHGSNIIWRDEGYPGLLIINRLSGREVLSEDSESALVRAGGGEKWDDLVAWSVEKGFSGIEFLSAIPGTVGAAPVQNIGAYGAELADTLEEVEAYDTQTDGFGGITAEACGFSYRNSRFKSTDRGRFIILAICLRLHKKNPSPPFYESLQGYFNEHQVTSFTPATVREAVIAIRKIKLPDPSVVSNNGSFFTNPIISQEQFDELKQKFSEIKGWPASDGRVKVSAGWLVEQCGFKGVHDGSTGMATWDHSALVMVNEHAQTTANLLTFRQKILDAVTQKFGITLEQEPELLP